MLNIVLTRIDDRLIHGQVMTRWVKNTKATKIVIVDDGVAKDLFMQDVIRMSAPSNMEIEIYNVDDAINALNEEGKEDEKVIILLKYPKTFYLLLEGGVDIKKLNVGGMGAGPGRKPFYRNISVSQEEREIFKKILEHGTEAFIQVIPDDKIIDLKKVL